MAFVKIRGSNYFYENIHRNNSDIILLIHGHPFDHTMWRYQYEALANFRLILPDLKGYGQSGYKFDKIYIEDQALDLALLLDQLTINEVHLIGLSMGGQIAVEFIRLFPQRAKSLVLCDSNPAGETEESHNKRLELANEIARIGMQAYTLQDIHKYLHPAIDKNGEVYTHLKTMMAQTQTEGAVASHRGRADRRDNTKFLSSITLPTLVIVGDRDYFTPVQEMEEIASLIPKSKFNVIHEAGHMPNMEQPEMYNRIVLEFYNSQ